MHSSAFLKLFPPPKFLVINYAGLDISDDAIHYLEYVSTETGMAIGKYGHVDLSSGIVEGGNIKDEDKFKEILSAFGKEHSITYVKVSIPEEKSYLFQTEIPNSNLNSIKQNIEFKLEENVPLAAEDAVFYFDLMPASVTGGILKVSVSVVARAYVEHYLSLLRSVNLFPVAFEVVPKAIGRTIVVEKNVRAQLVAHIMDKKTEIFIVSGGVVCFTSTIGWGSYGQNKDVLDKDVSMIVKELEKVYSYWLTRSTEASAIDKLILTGRNAPFYEHSIENEMKDHSLPVEVADVWHNILKLERYVPPITKDESLEYVVAAGLAMPPK